MSNKHALCEVVVEKQVAEIAALRAELRKVEKMRCATLVQLGERTAERDELRRLAGAVIQNGGAMTDGNYGCEQRDIEALRAALAKGVAGDGG